MCVGARVCVCGFVNVCLRMSPNDDGGYSHRCSIGGATSYRVID